MALEPDPPRAPPTPADPVTRSGRRAPSWPALAVLALVHYAAIRAGLGFATLRGDPSPV